MHKDAIIPADHALQSVYFYSPYYVWNTEWINLAVDELCCTCLQPNYIQFTNSVTTHDLLSKSSYRIPYRPYVTEGYITYWSTSATPTIVGKYILVLYSLDIGEIYIKKSVDYTGAKLARGPCSLILA